MVETTLAIEISNSDDEDTGVLSTSEWIVLGWVGR